jgi:hypothetical protein
MVDVVKAVFSIPASASSIESSFSGLKRLMDNRNSLSIEHLEELAVIRNRCYNAPTVELQQLHQDIVKDLMGEDSSPLS